MFGAVHWAFLFLATNTSVFWFAHASAVVNACSVIVAVLWAELKAAVSIGITSITLAFSIMAGSVVGALVRACFYFTSNTSPSTVAEACSVMAHTTSSAVLRAGFGGTVGSHPAFVAVACQVNGTDTVSAALLWACSAAAVFTSVVVIALAHTLVASSVVVALVGACFAATGISSKTSAAHALSTVAHTVVAALVGAAAQWGWAFLWASLFSTIVAFPSFGAFAAFVLSALTVSTASVGANLYGTALSSVASVALASAVLHAATMEITHFWAFWSRAVDTGEQFVARTSTFVFIAHTILGLFIAVVFACFSLASRTGEFLSMKGRGDFYKIAHASVVDAYTVSVAVVWAVLFGAVAATVASIALAFSVAHATAVESTFFVARNNTAVWSSETFLALAVSFNAGTMAGAVVGARLGGTVVSRPHLPFEGSDRFSYGVALTLSSFYVAFAVFNVSNTAQFSFVSFVTFTLSFLAMSMVPAVVWASFVLAAFASPVGVAQACAINARPLFLLFVAVHWALFVGAIWSFVKFEAFDRTIVHYETMAWNHVASVTGWALVSTVTLAFNIKGSFLGSKALTMPIAGSVWSAYWCCAVRITPPLRAKAGTVEASAMAGFAEAIFWAVNKVAVLSAEASIADASSVSIAGSML